MGLSQAPFDRILRNCGAERVSDDAARELRDVAADIAADIAAEAVVVSRHAGRKTVKQEDIDLASR